MRSRGVPRCTSGLRTTSAGLGGAIACERTSVSVSTAPSATPHWASVRSSGSGWWPGGATVHTAERPFETGASSMLSSTKVGISSEIGVSVETTRSTRRSGPAMVTAQVFMSRGLPRVHGADTAAPGTGVGGEKAVWTSTGRSPRRTSSPRPGGCGWALVPPSSGPSPGSPLSSTPGEPSSRRRPKTAS